MLFKKKAKIKKEISALEGFIQQIYWGEDLTLEQSKKNIEEGLIQITLTVKDYLPNFERIGQSNGLLITKDGYFLTAKHCIDHNFHIGTIKDRQGRSYPIEKVCAVGKDRSKDPNHRHDIALAKAKIDGPSEPMSYKIFNTDLLKPELPVALLYYDVNGKFEKKYGLVKSLQNNTSVALGNGEYTSYPEQFSVRLGITAKLGHSGGVIVCPEGRIVGIASTADVTGITNDLGGVKFNKALELIAFYKKVLMKKLE